MGLGGSPGPARWPRAEGQGARGTVCYRSRAYKGAAAAPCAKLSPWKATGGASFVLPG